MPLGVNEWRVIAVFMNKSAKNKIGHSGLGGLVGGAGTVSVFSHTNRVIDSFHGSDNCIHGSAAWRGAGRLPFCSASLMVGKSRQGVPSARRHPQRGAAKFLKLSWYHLSGIRPAKNN